LHKICKIQTASVSPFIRYLCVNLWLFRLGTMAQWPAARGRDGYVPVFRIERSLPESEATE